ncbi:hypothetical protein LTR56_010482 [Elasticomyces elasticus]|nr:hypothetical protein LTR56_010482 [Elasticomyces elasticus]KAK3657898.1 hypothetical protein LTR22_009125 [Elasticomyces elasticus]KAK4917584.1 hypothetical protein LTR49_014538 [Elasticomyces elasticus]KAK5762804.1 hypothetical protein LTS12_006993 [Elasticomyces elasticus]
MAPNFFDLPREIRDQIYTFYFATYASCPHGGCLKISTSPKSADKPLTSATAWCPAVEAMRTASKARNKEKTGPDLGNCLGSHHPTGLLLANRTTYHEAAEFLLQELPLYFKFAEASIEDFLLRWRHASPAKNVRSVTLDRRFQHEFGYSKREVKSTVALLCTVLPRIERVEFRLGDSCHPRRYEQIGEQLRGFKSLREVAFRDESKRIGRDVCDRRMRFQAPITMKFHVPVTMNEVLLESGMDVYMVRDY